MNPKTLANALLELICPRRCIECHHNLSCHIGPETASLVSPLCRACLVALPWWRRVDGCPRCGRRPGLSDPHAPFGEIEPDMACSTCFASGSALHDARSLLRYEGPVRRWIPGFKSARSAFGPALALRNVIAFMSDRIAERALQDSRALPDAVLGVPLHPRRRRRRGFNQIDPIAHRIAARIGRPWIAHGLDRIRDTDPQATQSGQDRALNLRGAFRANHRLPRDLKIWLVDDVLTTGSTLEAAAEALLDGGAVEVRALTLAATLPAGRARRGYGEYHPAALNDEALRSTPSRAIPSGPPDPNPDQEPPCLRAARPA